MAEELHTLRMTLRPFRVSDAEAACAWFTDREVMHFNPSGPDRDGGVVAARVQRYMDHQARHGFSKWLILERTTGQPLGDAGLFMMPDGQRVELGYRFARSYWGQGLATEVAGGWLEVAAPWYGLTHLYAFTHPENRPSQRVLEKLGFRYVHHEGLYGMEAPVYVRKIEG